LWLLGSLTLAGTLGTALAPYLLVKSPLLLVALSPAAHHVVLAAATVAPAPLLVVATLRRALFGVGSYGLGVAFGHQALGWLEQRTPRMGRLLRWVERLFARFGTVPTVAFFAGLAERRLRSVLPALLLGHALWIAGAYYVGDALAARSELFIDFLGEHLLESTLVCAGLVALQPLLRRLLRRRARAVS
jgi:hypothetical protein